MAYVRKATPRKKSTTEKKPTAKVTYKQLGDNLAAKITSKPLEKRPTNTTSATRQRALARTGVGKKTYK